MYMYSVDATDFVIASLCDLCRPTPIVTDMDSDGLAGEHDLRGHKRGRERRGVGWEGGGEGEG